MTNTIEPISDEELRNCEQQKTSRQMEDHELYGADWQDGFDTSIEYGRKMIARIRAQANLVARLRQQAEIHAQEARTANSIINECYQAVTGKTGEPGNWNGAKPIEEYVAKTQAGIDHWRNLFVRVSELLIRRDTEIARLREALELFLTEVDYWEESPRLQAHRLSNARAALLPQETDNEQ